MILISKFRLHSSEILIILHVCCEKRKTAVTFKRNKCLIVKWPAESTKSVASPRITFFKTAYEMIQYNDDYQS